MLIIIEWFEALFGAHRKDGKIEYGGIWSIGNN